MFRSLDEIAQRNDTSVGGKAFNLAVLKAHGLAVPDAVALDSFPESESEWNSLLQWWHKADLKPLAARSSARGEDASDASFAGQLTSVIGIRSEDELRSALETCFASAEKAGVKSYREHFGHELKGMNVLVQYMLEPLFSGVYFSRDPRGAHSNWLIEAVRGFGEQLVSGQVTPFQIHSEQNDQATDPLWQAVFIEQIKDAGSRAKEVLGFDVDMEWAIDSDGKFWCLQARPITTENSDLNQDQRIEAELKRLRLTHPPLTLWDGQTFIEWTGLPSPLSMSVWRKAFGEGGSFSAALQELGYLGALAGETLEPNTSLLESVFGRACLNLNRLQPLFFGRIPYTFVTEPHAHLDFSWRKIDAPMILHAPAAIFRMAKVAWNLQSHKETILENCRAELKKLQVTPSAAESQAQDSDFCGFAAEFAAQTLKWPFVLAMMIESTTDSLERALIKDLGENDGRAMLRRWMSSGLTTLTAQMENEYEAACADATKRQEFLKHYGFRGPGELDLARARWIEIGDKAFQTSPNSPIKDSRLSGASSADLIQNEIKERIHLIRRPFVEQEWAHLKVMLELREELKMEVMRFYAGLRTLAMKLEKSLKLESGEIFYLELQEIDEASRDHAFARKQITERKADHKAFSKIALPVSFSLEQIEGILKTRIAPPTDSVIQGEPLSPGLSYGVVRVVIDPAESLAQTWAENTILVADATDPGWTPLFRRASGVIVERGGVLSHCAIVAREMGLPAVSGIQNCTRILKDGDYVWVDGNSGRITLADQSRGGKLAADSEISSDATLTEPAAAN